MRWWLNTDHGRFSVDNAVVNGIDCSSLDPDVWMVQWTDGKGEVERQVDADTNDNGLRERFIDVIPYAPFFQQFLALCPRLTLTQAKKVDVDLIREIFESKRQAPFHYPVAAGDYWWDATDDTLISSTVAALQNATASLNAVITALNNVVAWYNQNFVTYINQNADIGNTLVGQINARMNEVNVWIVDPHNNSVGTFNSYGNTLVGYINGTILGGISDGLNTVNNKLQHTLNPDGPPVGLGGPGGPLAIVHSDQSWANPYTVPSYIDTVAPGTFAHVTGAPWTNIPQVSVVNSQWIPIGATAPVTVTPAEQAAILNGIAARTNALNVKKNIKIGQVNALTEIQDVIDYDVTTGW